MALFNFLSGEFIDVIDWTDDTRDTMVWRFERRGNAIKYGAKLTVRESQVAVFVHEGQIADVFTPGFYILETNNMPVMTTLQHWDHGFRSPFKSEIYFVSTRRFTDLKWGTKNPVTLRDPEFGPVRLRAFGTYSVRVTDAAKFITEIVGTDGEFTMDEIGFQIRNIIVQEFSRVRAPVGDPGSGPCGEHRPAGQVGRRTDHRRHRRLRAGAARALRREHLPADRGRGRAGPAHRRRDRRRSQPLYPVQRRRGDERPPAPPAAPWVPGSAPAWGWGMGMAVGGAATGPAGPWGARPAAALPEPPAPPPAETPAWHLAENGETSGPFTLSDPQAKAAAGSLTARSHVWTAGQDGWLRAGDVLALRAVCPDAPPPPPAHDD